MADAEPDKVSINENSEKNSTGKKSPSTKSGSSPNSAKSLKSTTGSTRTGSAKSLKSSASSLKKGKKKEKDGKKVESKISETPIHSEQDEDEGLPEGCIPLFLASKTQEIFECVADEHVTAENPLKLLKKEDILQDLFNRAAVCDFSVVKKIVQNYPADEILIGYDADFKYGENFYLATTEEAKEKILNPPKKRRSRLGVDGEEVSSEEEDNVIHTYKPPISKPWQSQGSEKEIENESLNYTRKKLSMSVIRKRIEFGASYNFTDRNVSDVKDAYIECLPFVDKSFDLKRIELNKQIQAIPDIVHSSTQTNWRHPVNKSTQYYPREFTDEEKEKFTNSDEMKSFVNEVIPRFESALQQNIIMDVFYDDWLALSEEDSSIGSKADTHLKEYQSFTDLKFSKDKTITSIEWHPNIKGIVAVAVAERMSFDSRIDNAAHVIMTPSLILIWSFTDPIHPQLLLEAPDDIHSFKFCPTDPNIIAGGCLNGQLVLWDISAHADRLKTQRTTNKRKNNLSSLPSFEDENAPDTPIIRYCAVSSIEHSHRAPITDVLWIPDHMELNRMGIPQENTTGKCVQIMTCSVDHSILVWDTRPTKANQHHEKKKDDLDNPMGIPSTFKHLDLTWKPHLKIQLHKSEPGGDHSPTKFSIQERQGDRSNAIDENESDKKSAETANSGGTGFSYGKPGSAAGKKALTKINTKFFVGTEDGEVVYLDWMPQKDQDSGKIQTPKPDFYHTFHDGPIKLMQRSPFFKDVILVVGGWNWTLWKEGIVTGPILNSSASTKQLSSGHWSPTRPSVFFITKNDGSVDVWDLLDRTHEPSVSQSVSPAPITCLAPFTVTNKQHLLAVSDNAGTLHILEIPWSLTQTVPNEFNGMSNYIEREVKRRAFVMARWDFREKEKMEMEAEAKRKAGIAPNVQLTDEEQEYRMKMEYAAYTEEENAFLRELGLKDDTDEPLPKTD